MYLGGVGEKYDEPTGWPGCTGHPWGPSLGAWVDQLNQAPWEAGPGAREHPQHPARGGRWSSWERNSQVLFAGQTWKVPTPCLTGTSLPELPDLTPSPLATPPHPPHPHPSPHIDSLPRRPQQSAPSSPFFLSLTFVELFNHSKDDLALFSHFHQRIIALCTMPAFSVCFQDFPFILLVFPFYDGPGSGFLRIYPVWRVLRFLNEAMCRFIEFGIYLLQVSNSFSLLHCSLSSLKL